MTLRLSDARLLVAISTLVLLLPVDIGKAFAQVDENSAAVEETAVPEPNLEDQLIKSLLRIRELESELRNAEQKLEALSAKKPEGEQGGTQGQSEYQPQNGREEICIQSILKAMRNDDEVLDWKLSCGEKLISRIVTADGLQQSGSATGGDGSTATLPSPGAGPDDESGGTASGTTVEPAPQPAVSDEPYLIVSGEDGKTPLMRQQREISSIKAELLPSSECLQAGKWLVNAAKEDLLLFSFFAVDRGQIGRCVQTNSGWRFERAGPFDEGYVLKANRKS
jgi:hypothetical protein